MFTCEEELEHFVSQRIAQLRIPKNVSARDMSLSIGQAPGYINNIENGHNMPSLKGLYYILEYLHVSPAEFFDSGNPQPEQRRVLLEMLDKLTDEQQNLLIALLGSMRGR